MATLLAFARVRDMGIAFMDHGSLNTGFDLTPPSSYLIPTPMSLMARLPTVQKFMAMLHRMVWVLAIYSNAIREIAQARFRTQLFLIMQFAKYIVHLFPGLKQ